MFVSSGMSWSVTARRDVHWKHGVGGEAKSCALVVFVSVIQVLMVAPETNPGTCTSFEYGTTLSRGTIIFSLNYTLLRLVAAVEQGGSGTKNVYSTPNSEWEVIDSFESGQEIEMEIVVVYYHWVREAGTPRSLDVNKLIRTPRAEDSRHVIMSGSQSSTWCCCYQDR